MAFKTQIFIHFDQADPAGILFFGNLFTLAHQTIEQMLVASPIGWSEWFGNSSYGAPLRHVEADFINPLIPGHHYDVEVIIRHVGNSSVKFEVIFSNDSTIHAHVHTSHVFVEKVSETSIQKREIPEKIALFLKSQIAQ